MASGAVTSVGRRKTPKAIVPLIVRWGGGASSDVLRYCVMCSKYGRKGASLAALSCSGKLEKWRHSRRKGFEAVNFDLLNWNIDRPRTLSPRRR